ncbi:NmrA-like family protein [Colletotrichum salicis]|uniref:NmrA-like family protein n=1 Tax=Colletotrichum salicis TaxID=1209931 RepID=A0A135U4E2_9PEZI|nr:NmrA-like family protein [Colletotrichum salicis]
MELAKLGDVEFIEGTFANESDLRKGFAGCWGAFVNIDAFNCGEKTKTYWTIRCYELAVELGLKYFVFGNLDYSYEKSGYDPKFRCGHYDGKGRLAEWLLQQRRKSNNMSVAIFTAGPYIEMTISSKTIMTPRVENGIVTWRVPLGAGAVPHVALDDCEHYARWLFDHPERSDGMDLEVAIDHVDYADLAKAFERAMGKPAQDNFSSFWTMWTNSGGNKGVIQRDYALLDEIHPKRIKTAEEFFRRESEKRRLAGLGELFEVIEANNLASMLKIG